MDRWWGYPVRMTGAGSAALHQDVLLHCTMSTNARRRLMKDVKRMRTEEHEGIMLSEDPVNNNIMTWHAVIVGPDDTLWEDLVATLLLEFTEEYPDKPPKISFLTKMVSP